jgi:hypothetical protein
MGLVVSTIMQILSQATADELMAAQNAAYISLFTNQSLLQGQVKGQKYPSGLSDAYMH